MVVGFETRLNTASCHVCPISRVLKAKWPKNALECIRIAITYILNLKKFSGGFPQPPLREGVTPSRAIPHSCLRHSATGVQWPYHFSEPDNGPGLGQRTRKALISLRGASAAYLHLSYSHTQKRKKKVPLDLASNM